MSYAVTIGVCTFNRLPITAKYLPSIVERVGDIDAEIIIWDNFSNDGTFDWLWEWSKSIPQEIKIVGSTCNLGMEAFNRIAAMGEGQYFLKIDDDLEVPRNFAQRLVRAHKLIDDEKLLYLSWDLQWAGTASFALRSGTQMYRDDRGYQAKIKGGTGLITNWGHKWLVNGACRLSPRDKFLQCGGHPKGALYGIDFRVSKAAYKHGYRVGFWHVPGELIIHCEEPDAPGYRQFKDRELRKNKGPRHV